MIMIIMYRIMYQNNMYIIHPIFNIALKMDRKQYVKSADVGQIMIVHESGTPWSEILPKMKDKVMNTYHISIAFILIVLNNYVYM